MLSFIPPDGPFTLVSYTVGTSSTRSVYNSMLFVDSCTVLFSAVSLPLYVTPQFTFSEVKPHPQALSQCIMCVTIEWPLQVHCSYWTKANNGENGEYM